MTSDDHLNDASAEGLHTRGRSVLEVASTRRRLSGRRLALQLLGLVIGAALLVWVVVLASSDNNAQSFEALRAAPGELVFALVGLSVVSLVLNGLMFWLVLLPLARISLVETILVNAIATFISILPFKLGLVTRSLIHHRRHGLRFKIIFPWMAALGALAMSVLTPLALAGLWRQGLDAWWWTTVLAGVALGGGAAVVLGRLAERVHALRVLSLGAHAIVRHPSAVIQHAIVRLADMAVLSVRFLVAASMIGLTLDVEQAMLIATTYFTLSILTPAGTLGPREMGVAALGFAQEQPIADQLALVALVVSAGEILSAAALGAIGAAKIRPDRLLAERSEPDSLGAPAGDDSDAAER